MDNLICTALDTKSYQRTRGKRSLTEVRNNETVRDRRGNDIDIYSLRLITPFKKRIDFHYGAVCHRQVEALG